MGFATVFASLAFIFIFASMIIFAATIQKNLTHAVQIQQERDDASRKQDRADLDIIQTSYTYADTVTWTETSYDDFGEGTFDQTIRVGPGSVTLNQSPYINGTFTSRVIDTGFAASNFTSISWTSVEPALTTVQFQTRADNSTAALGAKAFTGPDGTSSTYYTLSGTALHATMDQNRYFQYRATLNTSNALVTPELQAVTFGIQRGVGHIELVVENTGAESFIPTQTDVYIGPTRIARNSTQRTYVLDETTAAALWDPHENMTFTIFHTLTAGELATVTNTAASDSITVTP